MGGGCLTIFKVDTARDKPYEKGNKYKESESIQNTLTFKLHGVKSCRNKARKTEGILVTSEMFAGIAGRGY